MAVDLILSGLRGLASLGFLLGMLYFGFVLMRSRGGRWEKVFFWSTVGQLGGLAVVAVVSLVVRVFLNSHMGIGGVNWMWVGASVCKGGVLLAGLIGGVALLVSVMGRGSESR